MMSYSAGRYGRDQYGVTPIDKTPFWRRSYDGVFVGLGVQKSIGKKWTYRRRRQNAIPFVQPGVIVQDKYRYFVPSSVNNPEGQPARDALRAAVRAWQTELTDEDKRAWRRRANAKGGTTGYAEFVGHYIREALA